MFEPRQEGEVEGGGMKRGEEAHATVTPIKAHQVSDSLHFGLESCSMKPAP